MGEKCPECSALSHMPHADMCSRSLDDEPPVMGAGGGLPPMPTQADAEAAWRRLFAARLVEVGALDQESADACAAAGDVDLSEDPADAADDEMEYWDADE